MTEHNLQSTCNQLATDTISRQAAIDAINNHLRRTDVPASYPGIVSALTEWLNELPSAQPDSKESSSTHKTLDNNLPSALPEPYREDKT